MRSHGFSPSLVRNRGQQTGLHLVVGLSVKSVDGLRTSGFLPRIGFRGKLSQELRPALPQSQVLYRTISSIDLRTFLFRSAAG